MRHALPVVVTACLALIPGCTTTGHSEKKVPGTVSVADAPMVLEEDVESTFEYLVAKYDTDGDGRIARAEYDRSEQSFDRLDRDDDDVITPDDFGSGGGMQRMMQGMRGQRVVAWYFQDEGGPTQELELSELERSFAAYDTNGDGQLDREEFTSLGDVRRVALDDDDSEMVKMAMRDVDPWAALLASVDRDGDSMVSGPETVAFFESRDDGDLVWKLGGSSRGGPSADPTTWSGPPEGEMAPDFTLLPPDGGQPVTLSSFRGNLPVALIFGSYT